MKVADAKTYFRLLLIAKRGLFLYGDKTDKAAVVKVKAPADFNEYCQSEAVKAILGEGISLSASELIENLTDHQLYNLQKDTAATKHKPAAPALAPAPTSASTPDAPEPASASAPTSAETQSEQESANEESDTASKTKKKRKGAAETEAPKRRSTRISKK